MKTNERYLDLSFPIKGQDTSVPFLMQPTGTTPECLNVRAFEPSTDRARGASRPGLAKWSNQQLTSGGVGVPLQDINSIVLPRESIAQLGLTLTVGNTSNSAAALLVYLTGAEYLEQSFVSNSASMGCFDEEGNGYVVSKSPAPNYPFQITKFSSAGAMVYQKPNDTADTGTGLFGVVASGGILYVYMATTTDGKIYRFDTTDGSSLDTGVAWKNTTTDGIAVLPGSTIGSSTSQKFMSISGGLIGILGNSSNLVLQLIDLNTGTVVAENELETSATWQALAITSDTTGNFYVSTRRVGSGLVGNLRKIDQAGNTVWTQSSNNQTNLAFEPTVPRGLSFDFKNNFLMACGVALMGTTHTLARIIPGTGVVSAGIGLGTSLLDVACDSLGGMFVSQNERIASSRLCHKINTWPTVLWTYTPSGDGATTSDGAWVASTERGVPSESSMRSTRVIRTLAVAGGSLYKVTPTAKTTVTSGLLSGGASVVFSTQVGLYIYYTDGVSYKRYSALSGSTESLFTAAGLTGTPPQDSVGEKCRLIETWRGRLVFSGLPSDAQNWFMSAVDDPLNWNYLPSPIVSTQAIAGNNAPAGKIGDIVNTMIPYSDDVLIFGGDHSVWLMSGDPMAGGRLDMVTDVIGMAWGRPWAKGPDGTVFFFGSRGGIFAFAPGQQPVRMSQQISDEFRDINIGDSLIRMAWDDAVQGLHVFVSPLDYSTPATHYFWESRTNAWFPLSYENTKHNPLAVHILDGDDPDDRMLLMGGRDGFIRQYSESADRDDGYDITSSVVIGPFTAPSMQEILLKEIQAVFSDDSGDVDYTILTGSTAQAALSSTQVASGTWSSGRSLVDPVRRSGYAIYVKLTSTNRWAMEQIRCLIAGLGKVRGRGR